MIPTATSEACECVVMSSRYHTCHGWALVPGVMTDTRWPGIVSKTKSGANRQLVGWASEMGEYIPWTGMEATSNICGGQFSNVGGQAIICAKTASKGLWWSSPDVAI